jgi:long-chain acyl-CoA synthetase
VPDKDFLVDYAHKKQINGKFEDLCRNKEVKRFIFEDLQKLGKEGGLMSLEQVKNIHLHAELMSLENGLATATMKIKRYEVRKHFKDTISAMYQEPTLS